MLNIMGGKTIRAVFKIRFFLLKKPNKLKTRFKIISMKLCKKRSNKQAYIKNSELERLSKTNGKELEKK